MPAYSRMLAQQRQVQHHLSMLLRLSAIQDHAETPEAWEAVLSCKEKEIAALAALDLTRLLQEAQDFVAQAPAARYPELADLVALNLESLRGLCDSETAAVERARTADRSPPHPRHRRPPRPPPLRRLHPRRRPPLSRPHAIDCLHNNQYIVLYINYTAFVQRVGVVTHR